MAYGSQTSQTITQEAGNIVNETLEGVARVTFEQATEVTNNVLFNLHFIIIMSLFLIIYILWGAIAKTKTSSGAVIRDGQGNPLHPIQTGNFWIIFLFIFLAFFLIVILTIFPIHLKILEMFI